MYPASEAMRAGAGTGNCIRPMDGAHEILEMTKAGTGEHCDRGVTLVGEGWMQDSEPHDRV